MVAIRVEATVEADGELHLTDLPYRRGDKVETTVIVLEHSPRPLVEDERERERTAALAQFLALARSSAFHSSGPYPARDELHERH